MLKKAMLALILGLTAIGLASCENPESISMSIYRLEGKLPPGCKVTYGGEFNTGSRIVPVIIVDCRGTRATTSAGAFSSGKSTSYATTVMLTNE